MDNTQKREKAVERVKALFAMSQDTSSPREAEIAAKRMRSLMSQFGITEDDLRTEEFAEEYIQYWKHPPEWAQLLCAAAARLTDTRAICEILPGGRVKIKFQGYAHDVTMSHLMLEYLLSALARSVEKVRDDLFHGNRPSYRDYIDSYREGYAIELIQRAKRMVKEEQDLYESHANFQSDGKSLVTMKNVMVESHFGQHRTAFMGRNPDDIDGHNHGRFDGSALGLNKQVGG